MYTLFLVLRDGHTGTPFSHENKTKCTKCVKFVLISDVQKFVYRFSRERFFRKVLFTLGIHAVSTNRYGKTTKSI